MDSFITLHRIYAMSHIGLPQLVTEREFGFYPIQSVIIFVICRNTSTLELLILQRKVISPKMTSAASL